MQAPRDQERVIQRWLDGELDPLQAQAVDHQVRTAADPTAARLQAVHDTLEAHYVGNLKTDSAANDLHARIMGNLTPALNRQPAERVRVRAEHLVLPGTIVCLGSMALGFVHQTPSIHQLYGLLLVALVVGIALTVAARPITGLLPFKNARSRGQLTLNLRLTGAALTILVAIGHGLILL